MMQMLTLGPVLSSDHGSRFSGDSPGLAVWHASHPLEFHSLLSGRRNLQITKSRDVMQLVAN